MEPVSSILLVVPDTKYSQSVPVFIDTNVLDRMLSKVEEVHGAQYHQRICLPDAWSMAFRTLKIQSCAVARGKGCLAIVKCAARKNVVIPGNTSMIIQGKIDHCVFSSASLGVAEQLADSSLPEGMTITPVLMNVGADYSPVTIEVANLSSRPIVIEPSRTMCQIQSCAVETDLPADLPVGELNAGLQKIDLNQSRLSETEKQDVTKILSDWTDIFSANDLDVGLTSAVKHKECLGDLVTDKDRICQIYLDDILVVSKTFEEHVERLLQVFSRVREAGLKLSPKKCALFRDRVKYVGHVVSEHGVETDPEKIDKIRNWPSHRMPSS